MPQYFCHTKTLSTLAVLLATSTVLSGCILVTDTSRMNPDVFVQETAPVFYNPSSPPQPQPQPTQKQQAIPQKRQLYQSQFHQTYGMPVPIRCIAPITIRSAMMGAHFRPS